LDGFWVEGGFDRSCFFDDWCIGNKGKFTGNKGKFIGNKGKFIGSGLGLRSTHFLKFYFAVRLGNLSIDWLMEYLFWVIRVWWANRGI
jgi:hypothetical protein